MAHIVTSSAARVTTVVVQAGRKFFCPKIPQFARVRVNFL